MIVFSAVMLWTYTDGMTNADGITNTVDFDQTGTVGTIIVTVQLQYLVLFAQMSTCLSQYWDCSDVHLPIPILDTWIF